MIEIQQQDSVARRRPYAAPRLVVYGDVLSLTLGGSPGIGDSGSNSQTEAPPDQFPGLSGGLSGTPMP